MEISKTLHVSKDRFTPAPYDRIQWSKFVRSTDTTSETIRSTELIESGSAQSFLTLGCAGNNGCGPALIQTPKFI